MRHQRIFIEHGAEGLRARVFVAALHAEAERVRADRRQIHLHVDVGALRACIVEFRGAEAGLQLLDVVERAAHRGPHAEAVLDAIFAFERIHAVLEILRHGCVRRIAERLLRILGAPGCLPAARAKLERIGRREFGECTTRDIAVTTIGVVSYESRHALTLGVAAPEPELELLAGRQRRVAKNLLRGIAAERRARARAVFRRAAREQLDHAADGIGAVQRRAWPLHDLDALERFWRDVLQRGAADGAWIDAHAVDEHHGVVAFRTAREQRGGLPRAAMARDLEAGMGLQ